MPDTDFGGKGPARTGCDHSGHCMLGCKNGGKNTLDRNYLYLAEKLGVHIVPETTVELVRELPTGGYEIYTRDSIGLFNSGRKRTAARGVVFAAGALGTNKLLMECKRTGALSRISPRLGDNVRTNSEVMVGARARSRKEK